MVVKPAYPVINSSAALSASLVHALLFDGDEPSQFRGGGGGLLDKVSNTAIGSIRGTPSGSEGLRADLNRAEYGYRFAKSSDLQLGSTLGGCDFSIDGTNHWMLVLRMRVRKNAGATTQHTILHIGTNGTSGNYELFIDQINSGGGMRVFHRGASAYNLAYSADSSAWAAFEDASEVVTMVIASRKTGGSNGRLAFVTEGSAFAVLTNNTEVGSRIQPSAQITVGAREDAASTTRHAGMDLYGVQVFRRTGSEYSLSEMQSIANDPYQCFAERNHPDAIRDQASLYTGLDEPMSYFGDSQMTLSRFRLPHAFNRLFVDYEQATSMATEINAQGAFQYANRTLDSPSGASWSVTNLIPSSATLNGLGLANQTAWMSGALTFDGNVADDTRLARINYGGNASIYSGEGSWLNNGTPHLTLIYAASGSMTPVSDLVIKGSRQSEAGINTQAFAPVYTPAAMRSMAVDGIGSSVINRDAYLDLFTATGIDETGGELVICGAYCEVRSGGVRVPGFGFCSIAQGGWNAKTWLDNSSDLAVGSIWGLTVHPRIVAIMLGHNQTASHATQLNAGNLSGDYTDDIAAVAAMVRRAIAISHCMHLDWSEQTVLILATPWRTQASSPMTDATNAATVASVHAALASSLNAPHLNLYQRLGGVAPFDGVHPDDVGSDSNEVKDAKTGIVAQAWYDEIVGLSPVPVLALEIQVGRVPIADGQTWNFGTLANEALEVRNLIVMETGGEADLELDTDLTAITGDAEGVWAIDTDSAAWTSGTITAGSELGLGVVFNGSADELADGVYTATLTVVTDGGTAAITLQATIGEGEPDEYPVLARIDENGRLELSCTNTDRDWSEDSAVFLALAQAGTLTGPDGEVTISTLESTNIPAEPAGDIGDTLEAVFNLSPRPYDGQTGFSLELPAGVFDDDDAISAAFNDDIDNDSTQPPSSAPSGGGGASRDLPTSLSLGDGLPRSLGRSR